MPLTGDGQVNKKAFRIAINSQKLARFYPLDREKTQKIDAFLALNQCKSQHHPDQSGLQPRGAHGGADEAGPSPRIGERAMPEPRPSTRGFEPCQLQAMLGAFDTVCAQLRLPTHEGGWARKRVASMIFDLAMTGETDEKRLVANVLVEFRLERDTRRRVATSRLG